MSVESFLPDAENARAFRDALGSFTTGVTIVTVRGPDGPMGMTANSFASVSLDPPLILWSPAKSSRRYPHFVGADRFAVHILAEDQSDYCARFARGGAAFEGLVVEENATGVPLLHGALSRFECDVTARHDAGDHTIIIGHVTRVTRAPGEPLCFAQGGYGRFLAGL